MAQIGWILRSAAAGEVARRCNAPPSYGYIANYQEWTNVAGYTVDIAALRKLGVPLTNFATFFARNRDALHWPHGEQEDAQ